MSGEEDELLAIIARDGPSGITHDRKLIGAILTSPDYMVAGMFIPTDPEQAEEALIKGTGIVLWRRRCLKPEQEREMRDKLHAISLARQKSINEVWLEVMTKGALDKLQPHELIALIRQMPAERRQSFIDSLPPNKRPKLSD
jgi:hypothetical protein